MPEEIARKQQAKDPELERGLEQINARLDGLFEGTAGPAQPILFIVGHQRCGATLVSQYLAAALDVGYPSNLVARFWRAPVAGVILQRALGGQLGAAPPSFASELGTTPGLLDPHEFSYFWDHWFPQARVCRDPTRLVAVLGSLQAAFARPLLFKNVFNSLRVDVLAQLVPPARFLWVERDLADVARSTLEARRVRFGTEAAWFGVRGDDWDDLAALAPAEQVAAQIQRTDQALRGGWASLAPGSGVTIAYDEFCRAPARLAADLQARWGFEPRPGTTLPQSFAPRSRR